MDLLSGVNHIATDRFGMGNVIDAGENALLLCNSQCNRLDWNCSLLTVESDTHSVWLISWPVLWCLSGTLISASSPTLFSLVVLFNWDWHRGVLCHWEQYIFHIVLWAEPYLCPTLPLLTHSALLHSTWGLELLATNCSWHYNLKPSTGRLPALWFCILKATAISHQSTQWLTERIRIARPMGMMSNAHTYKSERYIHIPFRCSKMLQNFDTECY